MIAARPAVIDASGIVARERHNTLALKAAGLSFVAIVPALFWTTLALLVGQFAGYDFSAKALLTFGCSIATFLAIICAPLVLRS